MAIGDTKNIVPRGDQQGKIGTAAKSWAQLFLENPATPGGSDDGAALTISNLDTNQIALDVNANNIDANIIDVAATGLTTGKLFNFAGTTTPADTASSTLIDLVVDFDAVGTSDFKGIHLDIDKDGITASGKTSNVYGLHIDLDDSVNNVGTTNTYGVKIENTFANAGSGTTKAYGMDISVSGADTNYALITSGGNVGIGNTAPGATLEVSGTAASSEATRPAIEISSYSDANDAYTSAPVLKFHKSANDTLNTYGANSHTASGEVIGRIEGWGVTNAGDGSSDTEKMSSFIQFSADAVADADSVPGKIVLATSDGNDAGTPTARLTIDDGGLATFSANASILGQNVLTAPQLDIAVTNLQAGGKAINIAGNASQADTEDVNFIDVNVDLDGVGTSEVKGINLDLDGDGITASGKTSDVYGLYINHRDSVTNVGTANATGVFVQNTFDDAGGTTKAVGIHTKVGGGDTNYDIYMENNADNTEYAYMRVGTGGALTLSTVSDDTTGHLTIDVDGDIELNADGGDITFKDASTSLAAIDGNGAFTSLNYRTIYVDAGSMIPAETNGAQALTEEMHATNFTTMDYMAFDKDTEEFADFKLVMPEQYDNGTVKVKFYWKPADAESGVSVVWGVKAYAATDSDALTGASGVWGTEVTIEDASLNTNDDLHISSATAAVTIAGTPAEGKLVFFRVARKVADGNDDYADDAHLLGINVQYKEQLTASSGW